MEPAQAPDFLAAFMGQRLLDAALMQGCTLELSVGGVRLRFERDDLVIASRCDEWLLVRGSVPPGFSEYLTVGDWLARCDCVASDRHDEPEHAMSASEQPTEQPNRRTKADIGGLQAQVDEDQDHDDEGAGTDS